MLAPFGVDCNTINGLYPNNLHRLYGWCGCRRTTWAARTEDDPVYQERLEKGLTELATEARNSTNKAKRATYIFLALYWVSGFVYGKAASL